MIFMLINSYEHFLFNFSFWVITDNVIHMNLFISELFSAVHTYLLHPAGGADPLLWDNAHPFTH